MTKGKLILSEDVAAKFEVVNNPGIRFVDPKFGEINLSTLTVKQATLLVQAGFKYLVKVKKKK